MSAFRMRLEIEQSDDIGGGERRHRRARQNLFLRSRISANTSQAGLPFMTEPARDLRLVGAQERIRRFSSPMVAGIVGLPAARCA